MPKQKRPAKPVDEFHCLLTTADLGKYVDRWIAVVGDKIVAVGDTGVEVYRESKEKYPNKTPMVLKVPAEKVMLL